MAFFLPPNSSSLSPPFCRYKQHPKYRQVRSQNFREDGTPANMVDANLGVLRDRIAEVRMRERLDMWCSLKNGWNYQSGYDHKCKRDAMVLESLKLMGSVSGALGFVFLSGSLSIALVSLLVRLSS